VHSKEVDQHFALLEEQFINKMTDMGYEYTDIKDFIEDRGLPEDDPAILIAGLSQPHAYHNKLQQKANNMGQDMRYDFADPSLDPAMLARGQAFGNR